MSGDERTRVALWLTFTRVGDTTTCEVFRLARSQARYGPATNPNATGAFTATIPEGLLNPEVLVANHRFLAASQALSRFFGMHHSSYRANE